MLNIFLKINNIAIIFISLKKYYLSNLIYNSHMAQDHVNELKQKLQAQQAEFQRYKAQCKQLEQFLQSQSTKKEEQIRKLKQEAILKQKSFAPLKAQISQLQTQNSALKTELAQLKEKQSNQKPVVDKSPEFIKKIQELTSANEKLTSEKETLQQKIKALQSKSPEPQKNTKSDGDTKKLQQAVAGSKSKIVELEKQIQKLKDQLKKNNNKQPKNENKDNKQQEKLRQKVQKLQKKLLQSHSQVTRAEQKSIKLSKQVKQLKQKLSSADSQKEILSRKVKQLAHANSSIKKQQNMMHENQQNQQQQFVEQSRQQTNINVHSTVFSALMMTKKHYSSPFLQFKNDNTLKLFKSTKNGCFEKSLGSCKYRLNQISYNPEQLIQNCAKNIKENISRGIKNSITMFGSKKTTKKYLMANLVNKIKDFILQRISQSQEQIEAIFLKASPDPEKKIQMVGHSREQVEQILNRIIEVAQKSPRKSEAKKKCLPKPKARYFRISQGSLYVQIITTSFTNIVIRQNQNINQALNNIAYSRLPNALQPNDCYRHLILTLNPIVSLYEDCKNTLAIINCKKNSTAQSVNEYDYKNSPIKQQLNDTARKKLQSIQRQSQQSQLKIRKQQQEISFYKIKFDQLEVRLKNLLNTHRQQNTYLKKSPIILSYEKMLKFVHAVQAKNPTLTTQSSTNKFHETYDNAEQIEQNQAQGEQYGEDIL